MRQGYRQLDTWQFAMTLVDGCYDVTARFPASELYGLVSQIRRAAVSIPSNLAEGYCRRTTKAYRNHVGIALGSHAELETCLEIARRRKMLSDTDFSTLEAQFTSVGQMLTRLWQALDEKVRREASP